MGLLLPIGSEVGLDLECDSCRQRYAIFIPGSTKRGRKHIPGILE